jgi:uncharacterized membrane protein YuzA (DUF378 family)
MHKSDDPFRDEPPLYRVTWALLGAIIGGFVTAFCSLGRINIKPVGMTYADLAALVLTAITVLLAVFGVLFAAAALYGFRAFMKYAEQTAKRETARFLDANAARLVRERADAYVASSGRDDQLDKDDEAYLDELRRQLGTEKKP